MILFALEYYPRHVWSTLLSQPVKVSWNDLAPLQTTTLLRFQKKRIKLLWRFRYWKDRSRLGIELKYTRLLCRGKVSKFVLQKKLGFYVYCEDWFWMYIRTCLDRLGWETRFKVRQCMVVRNLRLTLDNQQKLEIKIHKTPVI